MKRKIVTNSFSILLLCGAFLGASLAVSAFVNISVKAEDESTDVLSIGGTCVFMRQRGTWSARLTPTDTPGVYDAQYVATFRTLNNMTYVGQIKSSFKTSIYGNGKSTGGGGNGSFEFYGNYEDDGIARCDYREIGGQRTGTLTVGKPKKGIEESRIY